MSYATLDEAFGTEFKFQNCNKKKQRKKINCNKNKTKFSENTEDSDIDLENLKTSNSMSFETFSNYNPNEIFEYSEDENKEITDEQNLLEHETSNNLLEQNNLLEKNNLENTKNKKKNKKNKNSVKQNNNNEQNHQFNEINNKINFLINQVNEKANIVGDDDSESNIHDLILFILFGVFVILILEALYKLVVELCKYKMFNK